MNGQHIRVIQTASTIGTTLKLNVSFIDMNTCPNYSNDVAMLIHPKCYYEQQNKADKGYWTQRVVSFVTISYMLQ